MGEVGCRSGFNQVALLCDARLTSWGVEMQHIPIFLEHVDLFYTGDRLNSELFQCSLEFPIIALGRCGGFLNLLSSRRAFST